MLKHRRHWQKKTYIEDPQDFFFFTIHYSAVALCTVYKSVCFSLLHLVVAVAGTKDKILFPPIKKMPKADESHVDWLE